jgi:hypothetical protein
MNDKAVQMSKDIGAALIRCVDMLVEEHPSSRVLSGIEKSQAIAAMLPNFTANIIWELTTEESRDSLVEKVISAVPKCIEVLKSANEAGVLIYEDHGVPITIH